MKKIILALTVAMVAIGAAACSAPQTPQPQQQATSAPQLIVDEQLLKIAERVPAFGGMFFDAQGDLNVYMTEQVADTDREAQKARVTEGLTALLGEQFLLQGRRPEWLNQPPPRAPEIKIIKGDYDIQQLVKWRTTMDDQVLAEPGIVFTDLDEGRNRLRIAVAPGTPIGPLKAILGRSGVPLEAVIIEEAKPFRFVATVQDKHRPVKGGIQVEGDVGVFNNLKCTLGFVAMRLGRMGFVTCSHCTKTRGEVESTTFHQPDDPLFSEGNKIGDELADPEHFTGVGDCPPGKRCRFSDSAFVALDVPSGAYIARTTSFDGSLTIDSAYPTFKIISETPSPIQNTVVHKVGRTTGWTYGVLTATCAHAPVADSDIYLFCQKVVSAVSGSNRIVGPGDSGSPAFLWVGWGAEASLAGVVWGSNDDGSAFSFSSMNAIELELGPLTTFDFPGPQTHACDDDEKCCEPVNGGCAPGGCIPVNATCQ